MLWEKRKDIFRIAEKDIYRVLTILDKYKKNHKSEDWICINGYFCILILIYFYF